MRYRRRIASEETVSNLPGIDGEALRESVIRAGEARDLPQVIGLIRALADFEKLEGPDEAGAQRLTGDFAAGRYSLLVADAGGTIVGYAIYFYMYSTFLARPTLYLEDLFVHPGARKSGIGERFMRALAEEAVRTGCGRFDWTVLDWNVDAQKFYRRIGAEVLSHWWTCRVTGEALTKLGAQS
jgi:GNAT superfamily N-acetyltransferase